MKTNSRKLFLILAVAAPFFLTSCNQDEGTAVIKFDAGTSIEIKKGENFEITGTIRSDAGTTISSIIAMVEYGCNARHSHQVRSGHHHHHHTHTEVIARRGDDAFTRNSSNEYSFRFDQDHARLVQYIERPDLKLIIEVSVRNGGESSEKLKIIVKDEECGCGHHH